MTDTFSPGPRHSRASGLKCHDHRGRLQAYSHHEFSQPNHICNTTRHGHCRLHRSRLRTVKGLVRDRQGNKYIRSLTLHRPAGGNPCNGIASVSLNGGARMRIWSSSCSQSYSGPPFLWTSLMQFAECLLAAVIITPSYEICRMK
jgi:hypothetical protein